MLYVPLAVFITRLGICTTSLYNYCSFKGSYYTSTLFSPLRLSNPLPCGLAQSKFHTSEPPSTSFVYVYTCSIKSIV